MAVADHVERETLILETVGAEGLAALQTQLLAVQKAKQELDALFKGGLVHQQAYNAENARLTAQAAALTRALGEAAAATTAVNAAAMTSAQAGRHLNQSFTAASYAFQDFASTGGDVGARLNSITNNIPGIVGGMGMLGIGISVATTAGVALYRNWDSIASLWQARNPFLDAAQGVGALEKALHANNKELDDLREKATLSNAQLFRMNELTREAAELEDRLGAARGAQKVREAPGPAQQVDMEEFASIKKQLGGPQVEADLRKMILSKQPQLKGNPAAVDDQVTKILANLERGTAKALEGLRDMAAEGHGAATPFGKALLGIPSGPPAAHALTDVEKKGIEDATRREAQAKKEADAARDKKDKANREAEKSGLAANLEVADTLNPGLRNAAARRLQKARKTGKGEADVEAGLAKLLTESGGLAPDSAADAARSALDRARRDLTPARPGAKGRGGEDAGGRKLRDERRKRAGREIGGMDEQAEAALVSGIPAAEIGRRITAALKAKGFAATEAGETAGDAVKDARKRAGEKLTKDYLSTVDSIREARLNERLNAHSETFATSDLTARVQSGVGQLSEAQKAVEKLGAIDQKIQQLVDKPTLFIRAKP